MSFLGTWARITFARWPNRRQRVQLASEYASLRHSELMIADLCVRNNVFSPAEDIDNLFDAGVAEGRRRAVLEMMLLARIDPTALAELPRVAAERESDA